MLSSLGKNHFIKGFPIVLNRCSVDLSCFPGSVSYQLYTTWWLRKSALTEFTQSRRLHIVHIDLSFRSCYQSFYPIAGYFRTILSIFIPKQSVNTLLKSINIIIQPSKNIVPNWSSNIPNIQLPAFSNSQPIFPASVACNIFNLKAAIFPLCTPSSKNTEAWQRRPLNARSILQSVSLEKQIFAASNFRVSVLSCAHRVSLNVPKITNTSGSFHFYARIHTLAGRRKGK